MTGLIWWPLGEYTQVRAVCKCVYAFTYGGAASVAEAYPEGWTVFDLERLIFGYDMLVLVPEVTAQAVIQAQAASQ
jgi:hypothetical protein